VIKGTLFFLQILLLLPKLIRRLLLTNHLLAFYTSQCRSHIGTYKKANKIDKPLLGLLHVATSITHRHIQEIIQNRLKIVQ
jgi:hypothetical protein